MTHTACLVCFISTVNGCSKNKKPWKMGASSGHITNLKQYILETFDIYEFDIFTSTMKSIFTLLRRVARFLN
jgi:hypothetical protein